MNTDSAVRAVVAFPLFDADDRQWIESIRAKHDPEAKRIAAHFTLVFPAVLPLRATEAHVARVAQSTEPIKFVLRRAAVVPDARGAGGHVFLLPEEGRDALRSGCTSGYTKTWFSRNGDEAPRLRLTSPWRQERRPIRSTPSLVI